jgi:hypothetical protein
MRTGEEGFKEDDLEGLFIDLFTLTVVIKNERFKI